MVSSPGCLSLREMCYPRFTGKETGRERKWLARGLAAGSQQSWDWNPEMRLAGPEVFAMNLLPPWTS